MLICLVTLIMATFAYSVDFCPWFFSVLCVGWSGVVLKVVGVGGVVGCGF